MIQIQDKSRVLAKIERNLSFFMGGATELGPEEVVRLTQSDLDRFDLLSKKRQARLAKTRIYLKLF
jgi:hypothetical protein